VCVCWMCIACVCLRVCSVYLFFAYLYFLSIVCVCVCGNIESFNIQINNPCSILMQETSKKFLINNSPYEKYKFFLAATQLEGMLACLCCMRFVVLCVLLLY